MGAMPNYILDGIDRADLRYMRVAHGERDLERLAAAFEGAGMARRVDLEAQARACREHCPGPCRGEYVVSEM